MSPDDPYDLAHRRAPSRSDVRTYTPRRVLPRTTDELPLQQSAAPNIPEVRQWELSHPANRDSHDLHLSPDVRSSVVDNMLLSLDQASGNGMLYRSNHDERMYFNGSEQKDLAQTIMKVPSSRSASNASEYGLQAPDIVSHLPREDGREYRSYRNGSIATSRTSAYRDEGDEHTAHPSLEPYEVSVSDGWHPSARWGSAQLKARSRGGSTVSSVDHNGFLYSPNRLSHSYDEAVVRSSEACNQTRSILDRSRPANGEREDYWGAPMNMGSEVDRHTVRSSPPYTHMHPPYEGTTVPLVRKMNSGKSSKSTMKGKLFKSKTSEAERSRSNLASDLTMEKGVPPIPALSDQQVINKSLRRPQTPDQSPVQLPSMDSIAHKPGFFRRMFGARANNGGDSSPSARKQTISDQDQHLRKSSLGSVQTTSQSKGQTKIIKESTEARDQSSLRKTPSSFFRRRKKSTSENSPAPLLPLDPALVASATAVQESQSAGSLYEAMDLYLETKTRASEDVSSPSKVQSQTLIDDKDTLDLYKLTSPSRKEIFAAEELQHRSRNAGIPDPEPLQELKNATPSLVSTHASSLTATRKQKDHPEEGQIRLVPQAEVPGHDVADNAVRRLVFSSDFETAPTYSIRKEGGQASATMAEAFARSPASSRVKENRTPSTTYSQQRTPPRDSPSHNSPTKGRPSKLDLYGEPVRPTESLIEFLNSGPPAVTGGVTFSTSE